MQQEPSYHDSFEGPEKLLEVWFGPLENVDGVGKTGLRTVERKVWDDMLALVKCTVLNVLSNDYFDAYLLSESSMFVWNGRLILKTCGTTTLLNAVPKLLEIAKSVGLPNVDNLFYSRKKFMFPEKQLVPHISFSHEVEFLDGVFGKLHSNSSSGSTSQFANGSAYVLGKLNDEHWYLYMTEAPPLDDTAEKPAPDRTLEILMGNLDPQAVSVFYRNKSATAREATMNSGIGDFIPEATFDDFLFDPCGYSVNGVFGKHYFTIHVTPQEPCSFASFETNVLLDDYNDLIKKVINAFKPGHFSATLFTNESVESVREASAQFHLPGYTSSEKIFYQFNNYNLVFVAQNRTGAVQKQTFAPPEVERLL